MESHFQSSQVIRLQLASSTTESQPSDRYEQQADEIANAVIHNSAQQTSVLKRPQETTNDSQIRHDFSQIRIHTDPLATRSAKVLNASAYTAGEHIVFADGKYTPQTQAGRALLAHELTHVLQQGQGQQHTIQRKKDKPSPPPFYQEALDRLKEEEQRYIPIYSIPAIRKFIQLAEAIDQEDKANISNRLDDFLKSETDRLPLLFPSSSLTETMLSRLLVLSLNSEFDRLKGWFIKIEREKNHSYISRRGYASEIYLWEALLEGLAAQIPEKGADRALKVLDGLLNLFEKLHKEQTKLDSKAIEEDRKRLAELSEFSYGLGAMNEYSIAVYFSTLVKLLRSAFISIQAAYQVVLDQAIADLSGGKTTYLDAAKDRLENRLKGLLNLQDSTKDKSQLVGDRTVEVTRSEFTEKKSRHLDFFLKGKAAEKRSVNVNFYDREMIVELSASEKELSFGRVFVIRQAQIQFLEKLFGLEKDTQGKPTAESQENAAAIAKLGEGEFQLQSDDNWRQFLLEKFKLHQAKEGSTKALNAVIKLLETYLNVFTTHTPYNIEDFGDNLLTKTFPRALTGQLTHDCGVYALRIAYMLSLLRDHPDLQLRFRFIVLPVHVGLIITGKDLPLYIAHNDHITLFPAEEVKTLQKNWQELDREGNSQQPTGKASENQFLGELAGGEFISGVDLPFKLVDVPAPKGKLAQIKADLWKVYTKQVNVDLFGAETKNPKSLHYQFHLRYLNVLEQMRNHYNKHLVPFWNTIAHPAWQKLAPKLQAAKAAIAAAKTSADQATAQKNYDSLVDRYEKDLMSAVQKVDAAFSPILLAQVEINDYVKKHPEVFKKGIDVTASDRLTELFEGQGSWWQRQLFDHLIDLRQQNIDAPFAKSEDLLSPID